MTLLAGIFLASLLGSVHCAAMCGAFACACSPRAPGSSRFPTQGAYHLGRLTSYVLLGALAGILGSGVNDIGALAGIGRAAAIFSALLMLLWAAATISTTLGARLPMPHYDGGIRRIGALLHELNGAHPLARAGAIGLLTTLIPCGWLYAFVAVAAGTGSPQLGAMSMAVFWAGTTPLLVALATGVHRLTGSFTRRLPVLSAVAVLVLALLTISGRLNPPHGHSLAGELPVGHEQH